MNYYNDNDPYAAKWLKNLIKEGLIPDGEIDNRDIREIKPSGLAGFTGVHFFAGVGGWPYALRLAGWPDDRPVMSGSCPCQPFSVAGKGAGVKDERHLWPAFRWLIAQRKPSIIFGEQVASKDGRLWLSGVRSDLEAMGYEVGAADLCAAGVGSPNIRQRLFWVAESDRSGQERGQMDGQQPAVCRRERGEDTDNSAAAAVIRADGRVDEPEKLRLEGVHETGQRRTEPDEPIADGRLADSERDGGRADEPGWGSEERTAFRWDGENGGMADAERNGRRAGGASASRQKSGATLAYNGGDQGDGVADPSRSHRRAGERGTQEGAGENRERRRGSSGGGFDRVADMHSPGCGEPCRPEPMGTEQRTVEREGSILIFCKDRKHRRISSQPGDEPLSYGLPRSVGPLKPWLERLGVLAEVSGHLRAAKQNRIGRLRGYGNAINPKLAAEFIKSFMEVKQ